jgi:methionine-rich copper-binding protein CopC
VAAASSDTAKSARAAAERPEKANTLALLQASPSPGATLRTAPREVQLTFSSELATGSTLTITGPDGAASTGAVALDGASMSKQLRSGIPEGSYSVEWRAKSTGGQPSTGSYGFTLSGSPAPRSSSPTTQPVWPQPSTAKGPGSVSARTQSNLATGPAGTVGIVPGGATTGGATTGATPPSSASGTTPGTPSAPFPDAASGIGPGLSEIPDEGSIFAGTASAVTHPGSAWPWWLAAIILLALTAGAIRALLPRRRTGTNASLTARAIRALLPRRRTGTTTVAPGAGPTLDEPPRREPADGAVTNASTVGQDEVIDLFTPVIRPPGSPRP